MIYAYEEAALWGYEICFTDGHRLSFFTPNPRLYASDILENAGMDPTHTYLISQRREDKTWHSTIHDDNQKMIDIRDADFFQVIDTRT